MVRALIFALWLLMPIGAMAQTQETTPAQQPQLLKPEELDQLLAPIALYPDSLLAQVLMASAYPLDIVQAERWLQANENLTGDQLKAAVDKQSSTKEQTVSVQQEQGRQVISIEPTDPNTVYVPYYDPGGVYGEWPYSD